MTQHYSTYTTIYTMYNQNRSSRTTIIKRNRNKNCSTTISNVQLLPFHFIATTIIIRTILLSLFFNILQQEQKLQSNTNISYWQVEAFVVHQSSLQQQHSYSHFNNNYYSKKQLSLLFFTTRGTSNRQTIQTILSLSGGTFMDEKKKQNNNNNNIINEPLNSNTTTTTSSSNITTTTREMNSKISLLSRPIGRLVRSTLKSPMVVHKKETPSIPLSTCIATTFVIFPIWITTFLPITILYQVIKNVGQKVLSPSSALQQQQQQEKQKQMIDSGYIVPPNSIIPRSERLYDVVVLGATGFTGRLAVRHLLRTYYRNNSSTSSTVKWAIAGRNEKKLQQILRDIVIELNQHDVNESPLNMDQVLQDINIMIVDTSKSETLPTLVQNTKCVVSTVGPYSLYGSGVVEFCCKFGTHYADITGEIDWIQMMIHQWQNTAKQTGAILVPFCGHDSIPWDLSVAKLQQLLLEECQGDELERVTFYDELVGSAPGGTLATTFSIIEGTAMKPPQYGIDPYLRQRYGPPSSTNSSASSEYICESQNPYFIHASDSPWEEIKDTTQQQQKQRRWLAPFIMASVNHMVVRWSHALRQQGAKTLLYRESKVWPNLQSAWTAYIGTIIFGSLLLNPMTSYILKKYVLPKSGEGPDMDDMLNKHFLCVSGEGVGVNGNVVESIFYLPKDPGCLETSRMLVEAGLCLALQEKELPIHVEEKGSVDGGGFYPPSVALGNDILLNRLTATGTEFTTRVVPTNEIV